MAGIALGSGTDQDDTFYNYDHFNENNLYRNRIDNANEAIPVIKEELRW